MPDITFEEPPKGWAGAGKGAHNETAAQLRGKPGQWAVVDAKDTARMAAGLAQYIRGSRRGAYTPAGTYEAMARSVDVIKDGVRVREHRVYARFVGEAK